MAEKRIQGNNRLDLPSKGRAYFDGPFGINSSNLPIIDEGNNQFNLTLNQEGITSLAPNVIVKPAPPTKSVQFNEDDEFGGTPDFVYDYYVENVGIGTYDPTIKTQIFNELGFNDDGTIYTIAPSGSNHIYVGGNFERYIGKEYNNIIKLDLSGSVDTSFNIGKGFNGPVYAITLKDDKLYVGGDFTTYSGSSNVNRIVRLNSNGTIDNTFNTNEGFDNTVYSILLSTITNDDAIFVGGNFTKYSNNFNSNKIIKITGSGTIDPTFNPNGGFDANPSSSIYSIVHNFADPTYLYVAGKFTNYSGSSDYQYGNSGILKISSSGQVDTSFNQSSSIAGGTSGSIVYTIYHPNANDLYIGGDFTKYSGSTVSKVTKLNKDTGQLEWPGSFPTLSGGGVRTIHFVSSSNYILIGGLFSISAGGGTVQKLTLLDSANGSLIDNNIAGRTLIGGGDVYTSAVLNNTASIIGGDFKQYRPNFVLGQVNPIQLVNCDKIIIVETPSLYPQTSSYSSFFSFDYRNRDSFFISTSLGVFKTISSSHNTSLVVKNSGYVGFNTGSPDSAFHLYYGEGPLMRIDSAYSSSILFVTSSGIVGVLTGLPNGDENVRLHVSGAIRAHLSESSTQYVITYNTSSGLFTYFTASGIGGATLPAPPTKSVQFNEDDEFGGTSDFVYDYKQGILPYGAVGIGIYDPTAKLHVSGTFQQGGLGVIAIGTGSHAQGEFTLASGDYSHAEGYLTTASGYYSHAEGEHTLTPGSFSHAEGLFTIASGNWSHAEGELTLASGNYSHAEGHQTTASGIHSHAEGYLTVASSEGSHAEGRRTIASGNYSHAEGYYTVASGAYSHAEGTETIALGDYSHAEGGGAKSKTSAIGNYSHAEGVDTQAFGQGAHSEGFESIAYGNYSHAGGYDTLALGAYSATWGAYTTASYAGQFVIGIHNIITNTAHSFIIGNGQDAANKKNLVETSGSNFIITGSLYLTESRNISQQHFLMYDTASGEVTYFTASSAGGSSTPAPPTKSIQYNNAGTFGGNNNFTWDNTNSTFSVTGSSTLTGSLSVKGPLYDNLGTAGTPDQILFTTSTGLEWRDNIANAAQDLIITGKNVGLTTIPKGTPLYFTGSGASGNIVGILPADAGNPNRMPAGGVAGEQITAGNEGDVYIYGFISGVNTSAFSSGDDVFVAVGGGYTNIKPTGSALIQKLGNIEKVNSSNGSGVIQGPSWYNDLPNWEIGRIMVGRSTGQPVTSSLVYLDEANGRLGLSTTSPSAKLEIRGSGATSATTALRVENANTSASLVVLDNGNVGISTTTPSDLFTINSPSSTGSLRLTHLSEIETLRATSFHSGLYIGNNIYYSGSGDPVTNSLYAVDSGSNNRGGNLLLMRANNGTTALGGFYFYTAPSSSIANTTATLNESFRIIPSSSFFTNTRVGIGAAANTSYAFDVASSAPNAGAARINGNSTVWVFDQASQVTRGTTSLARMFLVQMGPVNASSGTQTALTISQSINQSSTAGYTTLVVNANETGTGSGNKLLQAWQFNGTNLTVINNNGSLGVGTATPNGVIDVTQGGNSRILVTTDSGFVGLQQSSPAEYIHITSDPAGTKYIQIDAAQASNPPPRYLPTVPAKEIYGQTADDFALGTPDYWMEIKLNGNTVLIPCYLPN